MSMKELSAAANIPLRTLQRYVSDVTDPGGTVLARVSRELQVDGGWLLSGKGPMSVRVPAVEADALRRIAQIVAKVDEDRPLDRPQLSPFIEEQIRGPEVPALKTLMVGYLHALMTEYADEEGGVDRAFRESDEYAVRERKAHRLGDAEWFAWVAVREGAILARAYGPKDRGLADPLHRHGDPSFHA